MIQLRATVVSQIPVEAECIVPSRLAGKSAIEIAKLPIQHGNRQEALGAFFAIEGDASDQQITIEGDCSRVKWIGAGMTSGRITTRGDVGMHLGSQMRGGEIEVHGDVDDWVGAEMRGGLIRILGNAGNLAGAAYRGSQMGMRGGTILIEGSAGNEVGANMRRGLIVVGRDMGDFVGVNMIAGSVFVFGTAGIRAGAGMKRGTLGFFGKRPVLLPTFRYDCCYNPAFLQVYLRQLRAWSFPFDHKILSEPVERFSGDLVSLGKGEILCRTTAGP